MKFIVMDIRFSVFSSLVLKQCGETDANVLVALDKTIGMHQFNRPVSARNGSLMTPHLPPWCRSAVLARVINVSATPICS